jgi:hypothetical protein
MEDQQEINIEEKRSFYYIFHSPLDKVYNIFKTPSLHCNIFFQNLSLISMKKDSSFDESGNEITVELNKKFQYKFLVDNVINLPYYKSFTHKSISHPSTTTDFINTYGFYWNSTDKSTIFKFTGEQEESENPNIILNYIMENRVYMCQSVENYLMKTLKNLEENESISINRSILDTWNFITDINNQKLLCSNQNVTVKKQGENKLDIIDNDTKCLSTFLITKNGDNEDKKQYNLELITSTDSLPKQRIEMILVKMGEKQTFLIFKHIILEFIAFDILMSYSPLKKKKLKTIKNCLEENEQNKEGNLEENNNIINIENENFEL